MPELNLDPFSFYIPILISYEFFGKFRHCHYVCRDLNYKRSVFGWKSLAEFRDFVENVKFCNHDFSVFWPNLSANEPKSQTSMYFRKAGVNTFQLSIICNIFDALVSTFLECGKMSKFFLMPFGSLLGGQMTKKWRRFWMCPSVP